MSRRDRSTGEIINGFSPPIEALVEHGEPIRTLGAEPYPDVEGQRRELIEQYGEQLTDHEFLAVHETTQASAEDILENGFDRTFPRTTEESKIRADSKYFWIHETDIGSRPPQGGEHFIVFCALFDGHAWISSYGSINQYVGQNLSEYENQELLQINTYVRALKRGVAVDDEHTLESLLPRKAYK